MIRGLEIIIPSAGAGVALSFVCGVLGMLLYFIIDTVTGFRLSDWFAKGVWRRSPKAHILAHREKKRLAVLEAEKARRTDEIKLMVAYYAERKVQRRQDRSEWLQEFDNLTAEEDALADHTRLQNLFIEGSTSQHRYIDAMMWGTSRKRRW